MLEVVGTQVARGGVPAAGVVPVLDEPEGGQARFGLGVRHPRSDQSHSRVTKKLSATALSKQTPSVPVEVSTPISRQLAEGRGVLTRFKGSSQRYFRIKHR